MRAVYNQSMLLQARMDLPNRPSRAWHSIHPARLARVLLVAGHRAAGSVSSFGGSPSRQEIGLGDATRIEAMEVFWPRSGTHQVFHDVPLDALIRVVEGQAEVETLPLKRVEF